MFIRFLLNVLCLRPKSKSGQNVFVSNMKQPPYQPLQSILTLIPVEAAVSSIINGSGDVPVYEFKLKPQYPKM